MSKRSISVFVASALIVTPVMAQAGAPVRPSAATLGTAGVAAVSEGTTKGVQSGRSEGTSSYHGEGHGMSSGALAGLALGLTGTALAAYIATHRHEHRSPSPR